MTKILSWTFTSQIQVLYVYDIFAVMKDTIFMIIIMMCMLTGGVIVFAATSVLYMNQSVPPYAASLTSLSESVTQFPMSKSTNPQS